MTLLPSNVSVVFEFCATGPGGGVDPTCSPDGESGPKLQIAKGSKEWPEDVRKKLRALQSRLSRAKTAEAKAKVVLAINALIAEQSGVKAPAAKASLSAKDALLEAAKHVPLITPKNYEDYGKDRTQNAWILDPGNEPSAFEGRYVFTTPKGREFSIRVFNSVLDFFDDNGAQNATGQGEAHFIFAEVTKASLALAQRSNIPGLKFSADGESKGRKKLYDRLGSGLAELVPGAKFSTTDLHYAKYYKIQLRPLPDGVAFEFCPTGPGGGVDPTCSPANAGTAQAPLRVNQWPEADRRKLRALQSRLSRATSEEAKAAVRAQIQALRDRVNGVQTPAAAAAPKPVEAKPTDKMLTAEQISQQIEMIEKPAQYSGEDFARVEAKLKAEVLGQDQEYSDAVRGFMSDAFGPDLEESQYASQLLKACGVDNEIAKHIEFAGTSLSSDTGELRISLRSSKFTMVRYLSVSDEREKSCKNDYFVLDKELRANGVGIRAFSQQVESLDEAGFDRIETMAAGGGMVGYTVWPKFGYDWKMTSGMEAMAKADGVYKPKYKDSMGRTVRDGQATLQTPEGREWWKNKGGTTSMTFQLDGDTWASQKILADYRANRLRNLKAQKPVKLAFCPTGPGGGVDPTCSPANAGTVVEKAPGLAKAIGSKDWPDAAKKRLRALQSRLSRAKNAEAKALVIQSINALIKEQNGEKPAAPASVIVNPTPAQQEAHDIKKLAVDTKLAAAVAKQGKDLLQTAVAPIGSEDRETFNTLRWYTQSGFSVVNYALRTEPDNPEVMNSGDVRDRVKRIDEALNKFKTPVDMVVHRAVGNKTQRRWVEGYEHTELGYSSTSARTVAGSKTWDKQTRCIIKVPKGVPGVFVRDISEYHKEQEYLLGRGLKYRVLARQEKVPKTEAKKLLFGNRTISDSALQHKEYTIIHMEIVQ